MEKWHIEWNKKFHALQQQNELLKSKLNTKKIEIERAQSMVEIHKSNVDNMRQTLQTKIKECETLTQKNFNLEKQLAKHATINQYQQQSVKQQHFNPSSFNHNNNNTNDSNNNNNNTNNDNYSNNNNSMHSTGQVNSNTNNINFSDLNTNNSNTFSIPNPNQQFSGSNSNFTSNDKTVDQLNRETQKLFQQSAQFLANDFAKQLGNDTFHFNSNQYNSHRNFDSNRNNNHNNIHRGNYTMPKKSSNTDTPQHMNKHLTKTLKILHSEMMKTLEPQIFDLWKKWIQNVCQHFETKLKAQQETPTMFGSRDSTSSSFNPSENLYVMCICNVLTSMCDVVIDIY